MTQSVGVLFFCLGNICRSPLAEGVFRHLVQEQGLQDHLHIDSAATSRYEIGEPPHPMSCLVAAQNGITLQGRARQLSHADLGKFHYLIGMEQDNLVNAWALLKPTMAEREKFHLLRQWDPQGPGPIEDPYGHPMLKYQEVYDQVVRSGNALLAYIRAQHGF